MPQWRTGLTKSLHASRSMPESRYFQLATADKDGVPYCRTVVYRGLSDDNKLIVISDTRTEKYTQLSQQAKAQGCWYFSKTREQYRFSVIATIMTENEDRSLIESHWAKLSDAGKKQFLWGDPGTPRNNGLPLQIAGDYSVAPEHFCVILLDIVNVDYLNLRGNPQYRELHRRDDKGNWISQSIIP
ncbi:Pyridoxamine 5'-phosphate oxidase [Alteromonas sp. 38]|uniref:pyridoxamine 5'-phosphate oxidase family protein n=1 Tax=Alteromonas TaxID=226 RepID=UPI0012F0283C|nr:MULTISPECIES: pyridoxamine 5'-phosphate oxidase family protein [Alteromonas]CAD5279370.1 Pyridoxamine 5'-phosphate oxidase [Alteromonas sp. 154]VXB76200.1 Pyridoxamine 5'-phosphate oxidase [Alteromonas sp. 38]